MTSSAEAVIAAFENLPPAEREGVLAELIRRLAREDHEGPSDDDLSAAADELFAALDRQEDESASR